MKSMNVRLSAVETNFRLELLRPFDCAQGDISGYKLKLAPIFIVN